ncbi:major facilitator transporter [Tamlana nanhaiensis]|uniref:Major facilitator transporter n=1 Tax=Neotamlana nanhaiensis TaxID=1382798 RepID=A0A0D7W5G2_9FLAO|nr:MFS transporter [Tamlana nanhaiensis]KJD34366.1 major facilitator transporter [Tamlana nanhaiensis]
MEHKKGSLKSTIAVSITNYLDAGAIVAGASGLTLWQNYLSLNEGSLGWLNALSANAFGAAVGAIIGGFLADKYGRKTIYTYNMLVYMLGVAVIMFTVNFPMLLAGFLITGISVGAGVPASWTYISENSEVKNRGRNMGISQFAWGVGPTIILLLGMLLAPGEDDASAGVFFGFVKSVAELFIGSDASLEAVNVFSSRIIFGSLFIVAFIAWNLQRKLNESKDWEEAKKNQNKERQPSVFASFGSLFTKKVNIRTMLFLAGIYVTWNMVASVMGFFQQHIYETAGGLSNEEANMVSAVQWLVIIAVTYFGFSMLVDKVNQRWLYFIGTLVGIAAWAILIFIGIKDHAALWTFTILWGIHAGVSVQAFYALWASELFPAKYRAAAQGIMFFAVRAIAAIWGFGFVFIYGEHGEGFHMAANIMIGLLIVALIIGTIWTPKTQGKTLEQITEERYGDDI